MKKLIPAYVISFVFAFMVWLYEPITMYMLNVHDFWVDLHIVFKPLLEMSLAMFLGGSLLFTLIYFINKKFSKELTFYDICVTIFFLVFICMYIQGNFLASDLPSLDGTKVKWGSYPVQNAISISMWVGAFAVTIFLGIKFKFKNIVSKTPLVCFAVFVMLTSSAIASIRPHTWEKKSTAVPTKENYDLASTDQNLFVLLLDAVDGVMFDDVLNSNDEYKEVFEDFTFFKDTTSTYVYTRDSIPYILSGVWNKNEKEFDDYYNYALDNSNLLKNLEENDYNINLYEDELKWKSYKSKKVSNLMQLDRQINEAEYIKQQNRYILFKYLPFPLKKYTEIEKLNFKKGKVSDDVEFFNWSNKESYMKFKKQKIEKTDEKVFKFIHLFGAHVPFTTDKDLKYKKNATYYDGLEGCVTIVKAFLDELKANDVYDNSAIIILSDHGYALGNGPEGRQNPILFIKGVDEHHELEKSKLPISYTDLDSAYTDLMDGKKSDELFSDVEEDRERTIILYEYLKEDHMMEAIQKGKAWNEKTLKRTGKEYNKKK